MIPALLLAASSAPSVIDAERAFAKLAQKKGQWTAFRATAASDAVMFVPEPTNAQAWLKDKKDPSKSVAWQPTKAWQSCDGSLAVTTGNWHRPDGSVGYFTTVWKGQPDGGWKWVFDSGDVQKAPRPAAIDVKAVVAACEYPHGKPPFPSLESFEEHKEGSFIANDGTIYVSWASFPDGRRALDVYLADRGFVLNDVVKATPK